MWFSFRLPEVTLVSILGDPGAVSRVDKMSVVKVYCKLVSGRIVIFKMKFTKIQL